MLRREVRWGLVRVRWLGAHGVNEGDLRGVELQTPVPEQVLLSVWPEGRLLGLSFPLNRGQSLEGRRGQVLALLMAACPPCCASRLRPSACEPVISKHT